MKFIKPLILILFISFLHSCAPPVVKVTGVTDSGQKIFYDGSVTSEKKHAVTMSHYRGIEIVKDKTIFMMVLQNGGDDTISVSPDNISVMFEENGRKWAPKKINIQSLDDFMKDLEEAYYNEEGRIIKDIFRKVSKTADDIDRAREDREKEMAAAIFESKFFNDMYMLENSRKYFEQLEYLVPEIFIKKRSIMPGYSINVIVACDTRDMDPKTEGDFEIVVSIDGEEHKFTFTRSI